MKEFSSVEDTHINTLNCWVANSEKSRSLLRRKVYTICHGRIRKSSYAREIESIFWNHSYSIWVYFWLIMHRKICLPVYCHGFLCVHNLGMNIGRGLTGGRWVAAVPLKLACVFRWVSTKRHSLLFSWLMCFTKFSAGHPKLKHVEDTGLSVSWTSYNEKNWEIWQMEYIILSSIIFVRWHVFSSVFALTLHRCWRGCWHAWTESSGTLGCSKGNAKYSIELENMYNSTFTIDDQFLLLLLLPWHGNSCNGVFDWSH